jgi:hypothetical protein
MKKTFSFATLALTGLLALGLAGCGKGNAPPTTSTDKDKIAQYATCMQKYGVNIPVPDDNDPAGGVVTLNTADPKTQAAQAACARYAPAAHKQGELTAAEEDRGLKLAECLRKHGIKAQDPQTGSATVTIEEGATYTSQVLVAAYTVCNKEVPAA